MVDLYSSHSKHPSFSSTLLDAIYRSIDQGSEETTMMVCGETRRKKESKMVEVSGKVAALEENYILSSWDSSRGGGGSALCASLEGDASFGKRLKPIRVWDSGPAEDDVLIDRTVKNQDGLWKKNSRALKMYAGLKKVKQPISPTAARLAGFLNSLFSSSTGKHSKKPMTSNNNPDMINSPILKSTDSSTCSSASSYSRSCLSKTPSCRGKPNSGEKRSVRFSPVSVILNQNSQSYGDKLSSPKEIRSNKPKLEEVKNRGRNIVISATNIDEQMLLHAKEMNKKVEEAARDLLLNYQKKMDCEFPFDRFRKTQTNNQQFDQELDEESEEDDDAASYASSDLFELPVYETTYLSFCK